MMTNRERVLAIMDGKMPDQIPWIPRMLLWWLACRNTATLPERYGEVRGLDSAGHRAGPGDGHRRQRRKGIVGCQRNWTVLEAE